MPKAKKGVRVFYAKSGGGRETKVKCIACNESHANGCARNGCPIKEIRHVDEKA